MDAIKKTHEVQLQVRHNAEEMRNTLNNLYRWEQEMKAKEKEMSRRPVSMDQGAVPVRSHVAAKSSVDNKAQQQAKSTTADNGNGNTTTTSSAATTATEKLEKPLDPNEEKRKQANDFKDKGNKYVKLGEYEKAIFEYTRAIDIFPEDAVYYCNRALCYLKLEKYNICIEDCEQAIEIDNLSVKAYYRRMQANECLGNNMDALKDCTTVLMIEPKNSEAKRSLERINERLRKNVKTTKGPNFTAARENMIDILPTDKPPYKRSKKPLRRVPIADVVGPKDTKNCENSSLKISDDDIDKLFNSNCGPFVEVKQPKSSNLGKNIKKENTQHRGEGEKLQTNSKQINENHKLNIEENCTSATKMSNYNTAANMNTFLLNANRPLPPAPTSTAQFYSNWKELAPAQKYQYLKSIQVSELCKILGAGFDSDTLTDTLHTLRDFYLTNKDETIAGTLLEVSKNEQVHILSLLMSAEEQRTVMDIVKHIKENETNNLVAEQIIKNFNLN
ncbi:RNA polymerase II-associated protein 3 isoform X2 [Eurosta solidaginis]|uniref:RNA polymerase II-associated protein 3 isoform X2 n=1 Tax=Eurosta solidaginis TaxID=178769 RepID=UPI003531522C